MGQSPDDIRSILVLERGAVEKGPDSVIDAAAFPGLGGAGQECVGLGLKCCGEGSDEGGPHTHRCVGVQGIAHPFKDVEAVWEGDGGIGGEADGGEARALIPRQSCLNSYRSQGMVAIRIGG